MAVLTLDAELSIGILSLDQQHRALFGLIHELSQALWRGESEYAAGGLMHQLVNYIRQHFESEEDAMRYTEYNALAEHAAQHQEFMRLLDRFEDLYRRGEAVVTKNIVEFIEHWLTDHVLGEDKKFGLWAKRCGMR